MPEHVVVILGFHKIGPSPRAGWESWFYVSQQVFAGFLTELRTMGWELIDLDRFLDGLSRPDTLPRRAALLTFDDSYRSMREIALPILKRFDAPAVMFVPTDYIGRWNTFDAGVEPDEPMCDWEDLRALARQGVSIQSHATSHRRFSELTPEEREREVIESKAVLEHHVDRAVEMLSFPYGDPGTPHDDGLLVRAGYRAACLYGGRGARIEVPVRDPYRLTRLAMGPDTDLRDELGALW